LVVLQLLPIGRVYKPRARAQGSGVQGLVSQEEVLVGEVGVAEVEQQQAGVGVEAGVALLLLVAVVVLLVMVG
jgi:hypothetical protein